MKDRSQKNYSIVVFLLILPTPSVTSVLGTKRCSNRASRDFQFGVYDVLYDFFSVYETFHSLLSH